MAQYYLISQLPSLDGIFENMPIPITEERFSELCDRFLGKKAQSEIKKLTLMPPRDHEESAFQLIKAWNESERNLRLALAKARAEKMKKTFDAGNRALSVEFIKAASTAIEMGSPMEAEKFLNSFRLELLEELRPMDNFSEEFVLYYGLKLKLLYRMRQFDVDAGEAAYRNIYNSVLSGDRLEAIS